MKNSPKFDSPPVDEVAIGFGFNAISDLDVLDFASLWHEFEKIGFTSKQVHSPVPTRGSRVFQNVNLQLKAMPDLPRFWFIKDTQEFIIQIQKDKFIVNWRISDEPTGTYISFKKIQQNFWQYSEIFRQWVEKQSGERLKLRNLELTYYNTIPIEHGLAGDTVSGIFKDFQWSEKSILSNMITQMFFEVTLPVEKINAQLFIMGHTAQRVATNADIFRLEMAVVGKNEQEFNKRLISSWYDEAHDQIVHGFVELTTPKMHKEWGYEV